MPCHAFKISRISSVIAIALASSTLSAATLTVDATGAGGAFTTIQAAVDAAASGDIILIKPHTDTKGWRENIVVNTANLTLRGDTIAAKANLNDQICPTVYLDGCETPDNTGGCDTAVLTVNATEVTLERVFVRHGYVEFSATANNGTVRESCVLGDVNDPIRTSDPGPAGVTVERNVFQGGSSESVAFYGDNHVIQNNVVLGGDDGFYIEGDGGRIANNTIHGSNDDTIEYRGNNGVIENNLLSSGDGSAINYSGNNPTITGNVIEDFNDDGIAVSCDSCTGGTIADNRIVSGGNDDDEGIYVSNAVNFLIENNIVRLASQDGIRFSGTDSIIRNNTIHPPCRNRKYFRIWA